MFKVRVVHGAGPQRRAEHTDSREASCWLKRPITKALGLAHIFSTGAITCRQCVGINPAQDMRARMLELRAARVTELVDVADLKSAAERCEGSSPSVRTNKSASDGLSRGFVNATSPN